MQQFIVQNLPEIVALCREHQVRRLALFGSAVREDFDPDRSDVDILVEFEAIQPDRYFDNKSELRAGLAHLFGRQVDLLTWKSIRNPYFLREVEATQEFLYAA